MIGRLKKLFERTESKVPAGRDTLQLAAAALLVEAAAMDGHIDDAERATIEALLKERFSLSGVETWELLTDAEKVVQETGDLYRFTRVIKDAFTHEERVGILEMLWEVALADGRLDHFEANLTRRVAGLLYVPDRESGEARRRAAARLKKG